MTEDWQHGGFGLYIHWPFCESKCPYCDFNSHVQKSINQQDWARAYVTEIDRAGALTGERVLQSIYFGGGTPSLMETRTIETILDRVRETWRLANDVEITLEANPGSVETARFRGYRAAGVNRVSLGVQALNDPDLQRLGRLHSADQALRAIDISQSEFDRSSFDLIYGRQDQSLLEWETELERALALAQEHLSLYQLTIEQGTAFGDRYSAGKLRGLPDETLGADMYELTQARCEDAVFPAYEISNHARPGNASRHNLIYWNYGDYIGIGPGAHGRVTLNRQRHATVAASNPQVWLKAVTSNQANAFEALSYRDQAVEYLMMGMRTSEPLDIDRFERLTGLPFPREAAQHLQSMGFVTLTSTTLTVTPTGRPLLNALVSNLVSDFL